VQCGSRLERHEVVQNVKRLPTLKQKPTVKCGVRFEVLKFDILNISVSRFVTPGSSDRCAASFRWAEERSFFTKVLATV
jgi:hypothetical protein